MLSVFFCFVFICLSGVFWFCFLFDWLVGWLGFFGCVVFFICLFSWILSTLLCFHHERCHLWKGASGDKHTFLEVRNYLRGSKGGLGLLQWIGNWIHLQWRQKKETDPCLNLALIQISKETSHRSSINFLMILHQSQVTSSWIEHFFTVNFIHTYI